VAPTVRPYDIAAQPQWDSFVETSKNGTFLFLRDYMDYHRDRFADQSLLVLDHDQIIALFPANRSGDDVHSHQGLSYGGLVTSAVMTTPVMLEVFAAVTRHFRDIGIRRLFYKTMPSIYHQLPAEEDRYALFVAKARLYRRDVLSVVPKGRVASIQVRRRRGAEKATKAGVVIDKSADWLKFWSLLSNNLENRFGVAPVHSFDEIEKLQARFPRNIGLHTASLEGEMVAGVVVYESATVAHTQYIATSQAGRETGALDKLFIYLLDDVYAAKPFFDFGPSHDPQDRALNRGLIEQKEGFGARAVMHDFYDLEL
jgi:hypothetical protein